MDIGQGGWCWDEVTEDGMVGMSDLRRAGKAFAAARDKQQQAAARLHEAIRLAVMEGMSESEAARVAGVDRMTVRRALGNSRSVVSRR